MTTTLNLSASFESTYLGDRKYDLHPERPQGWGFSAHFADTEAAEAFAAQFPKSLRMRTYSVYGTPGFTAGVRIPAVTLSANGVNGGRNETGVKRLHTFLKAADRLGYAVTMDAPAVNSYKTLDDLLAAVA